MRALSFLLILLAIGLLRPDSRVERSALSERAGVLYQGQSLFTGIAVERYPTSDIFKESQYKNGLREGETREFGVGGKRRAIWSYHQGLKDGRQVGWFLEGPKRFVQNFTKGVLNGEQVEWHQNGAVFRQQIYANGVETEKKIFYAGSEIFTNYKIREGRQYGIDGGPLCMETKPEGAR